MKSHYSSEEEGLIEALLRELPARSREDVEGHEQWHRRYLHLLEEKKAAIAEWRQERKVNLGLCVGCSGDALPYCRAHACKHTRCI